MNLVYHLYFSLNVPTSIKGINKERYSVVRFISPFLDVGISLADDATMVNWVFCMHAFYLVAGKAFLFLVSSHSCRASTAQTNIYSDAFSPVGRAMIIAIKSPVSSEREKIYTDRFLGALQLCLFLIFVMVLMMMPNAATASGNYIMHSGQYIVYRICASAYLNLSNINIGMLWYNVCIIHPLKWIYFYSQRPRNHYFFGFFCSSVDAL